MTSFARIGHLSGWHSPRRVLQQGPKTTLDCPRIGKGRVGLPVMGDELSEKLGAVVAAHHPPDSIQERAAPRCSMRERVAGEDRVVKDDGLGFTAARRSRRACLASPDVIVRRRRSRCLARAGRSPRLPCATTGVIRRRGPGGCGSWPGRAMLPARRRGRQARRRPDPFRDHCSRKSPARGSGL